MIYKKLEKIDRMLNLWYKDLTREQIEEMFTIKITGTEDEIEEKIKKSFDEWCFLDLLDKALLYDEFHK